MKNIGEKAKKEFRAKIFLFESTGTQTVLNVD